MGRIRIIKGLLQSSNIWLDSHSWKWTAADKRAADFWGGGGALIWSLSQTHGEMWMHTELSLSASPCLLGRAPPPLRTESIICFCFFPSLSQLKAQEVSPLDMKTLDLSPLYCFCHLKGPHIVKLKGPTLSELSFYNGRILFPLWIPISDLSSFGCCTDQIKDKFKG